MLQVPFYLNHGHRCAQAVMKSVIAANPTRRVPTFKELEYFTDYSEGQITLPCQIAYGLMQLGIDFKYFVRPDWERAVESEWLNKKLKESYGLQYQDILRSINTNVVTKAIRALSQDSKAICRDKKPMISELASEIENQRIPICLINFDQFVGREDHFRGHYIILTDINKEEVTYQNNGPCDAGSNLKMSLDKFVNCWNLCFMDHDLILVN